MQMLLKRSALLLVVAGLTACASGPKYSEIRSSIPALSADKGRVVIYRSEKLFGAGIQPAVLMDAKEVGQSTPGGWFFVDVDPGSHNISLTSEVEKKLSFAVNKGESKYVKLAVGLGVVVYRVYPELIDPLKAETDLTDLAYIGPPLK